jgi:hypothetical protein
MNHNHSDSTERPPGAWILIGELVRAGGLFRDLLDGHLSVEDLLANDELWADMVLLRTLRHAEVIIGARHHPARDGESCYEEFLVHGVGPMNLARSMRQPLPRSMVPCRVDVGRNVHATEFLLALLHEIGRPPLDCETRPPGWIDNGVP